MINIMDVDELQLSLRFPKKQDEKQTPVVA